MFSLEKIKTSPLCILCMLMPQIITLLTLMLICTWYKESNLGVEQRLYRLLTSEVVNIYLCMRQGLVLRWCWSW